MLWDDLEGWNGGWGVEREGGDVYIHIADSFHYTEETITTS